MTKPTGRCHCGTVTWAFSLPVKTVVKCHCNNCRKLQGSDYSCWIIVPKAQFELLIGHESLTLYQANKRSSKSFCSRCGSACHLVNGRHFPDCVVLPLGAVERFMPALAPQVQVYTANKAAWVNLHDDEPVLG
ncbi:GFA family protein [Oceanimonas pelagia]|uniref:GFA family protein n=1 Tax=Oceanimonas pelagia TaxID=3028314 RepID=A0AA50QDE4_9GAMM|nr:GFA family protein [Oceanimonas pelagia]WMC12099.1 GFA family protein [Oceanimonas pelagia]